MIDENIVYVKIKNGIFKCYKSEQMRKPIYYPVESKTNGYIDYNDVEKILTIEDLYQENQELKNNVNALQKELNEENLQCSKYAIENQELKKQLEEKENNACNLKDSCLENAGKIEKLETQQKEFIEWLENENRKIYRDFGLRQNIFKQVLQKYKEITGDDK